MSTALIGATVAVAMLRGQRPSPVCALRWEFPGVGVVRMTAATTPLAARIDAAWSHRRRPEDLHSGWSWLGILNDCRDGFVLVACDRDEPVGVFASEKRSPITLEGRPYYRLDYLEIDPALRGSGFGSLALALVGVRAVELGAGGIVLGAFQAPKLLEFYEESGATRGCPRGWNPPSQVIPLTFDNSALMRLEKEAHAFRHDPTGTREGSPGGSGEGGEVP